jgi:phosphoribosylamine---glycine ligase
MNVLLIGNGGREHALADALSRSARSVKLYVFGNKVNPGIKALATDYHITSSLSDFEALKTYARALDFTFALVGPDNPIADGAVDELESIGVKAVAPYKVCAQLESSKFFARDLLRKYEIPGNTRFEKFDSETGVMEWLKELGDDYVVKADGLAYGKGVKVAGDHLQSHEEALDFVREILEGGHSSAVIEEKLHGVEFSGMAFCDGRVAKMMPLVQDHKRAYVGDTGPNTGGMGSYSDANGLLPFLTADHLRQADVINNAVLKAVEQETGQPYVGILYGGFMVTRDGVKLIEYNVRFGDPEAMNVLPILKTDIVDVCLAMLDGSLAELDIEYEEKATVCKYVVPKGYPEQSIAHAPLKIGEMPEGCRLFYSSVSEDDGVVYTSSSRALGLVGIADTLSEAEDLADAGFKQIHGQVTYRADIGTVSLIQKRIDMAKELGQL